MHLLEELRSVKKGLDNSFLRWFDHLERIENDRIAKRMYVGDVGRPRKKWIDSVNHCLKKRGLNVGKAKKMVYDRNEWREFVRGNG